jgi:hypothetical protein
MVNKRFYTDPLECLMFIKDTYGGGIFLSGRRLSAIFADLCPKQRSFRSAFGSFCNDSAYGEIVLRMAQSDRNKLMDIFGKLRVRVEFDADTADTLFRVYAAAFEIDIAEPQIVVVKTVTAMSPKRRDVLLSGKFSQSAAVTLTGKLYTWGANEYGSTGVGDDAPVRYPTCVAEGIKSVSMGFSHSLAVKYDGTLLGFGENRLGGLGPDASDECHKPVPIMRGIAFADCGGRMHSYAGRFDGSLINLRIHRAVNESERIILTDTVSVSAGMLHALAVRSDGTLWAWGENRFGQLGDGTRLSRKAPVFIMNDVIFACAGTYHSLAIKSDHTLWTWGLIPDVQNDASSGGSEISETRPVMFMSDIKSAAAGELHSLAVKTDGSLYAWGKNFYGQLGDGTDVNKKLPVKIMDGAEDVAAGVCYSLCRKTDGTLYAWGLNESYELGDGTDIDRRKPVKIDF